MCRLAERLKTRLKGKETVATQEMRNKLLSQIFKLLAYRGNYEAVCG